jgi:SanA protein
VVRCREIFSQDSILVISQKFHNERAIFIADSRGITAVGFNAVDIKGIRSTRVKVREKLARVKVVLDMLFGVQPKFSGEKIDL